MSTGTATAREVLVPDIGDFADVPVIEVLVSPGDTVSAEDPLVTLESDKATMDVPAPFGGTVQEIKVSAGDRVSEGALLMTIAPEGDGGSEKPAGEEEPEPEAKGAPEPAPAGDVAEVGGAMRHEPRGGGAENGSILRIGEPSETLSLTLTRISWTLPANGDGTSMVALSDSSVTSGVSTPTSCPGSTRISITGTSEKSPMSGTVTSRGLAI